MFESQKFAIYYIFLLATQCTYISYTSYIENRIVKRADSHITVCS